MSNTLISWTDTTDNIITVEDGGWWCRRVSAGCDNCYAAALNQNTFFGGNKLDYSGQPPQLVFKEELIKSWQRQTKSKKHFVSSMTDVFGEWVPREWHFKMLDGMWNAPKQTFQLLTKRPEIMRKASLEWMRQWDLPQMPKNIWLGTTVEDCVTAKKRIPVLQSIPTSVRFLSCEPLLEDLGNLDLLNIQWVVVGGESGSGARKCYLKHIYSIVEQCRICDVAVFVKQLGSNPVEERILDFGMPDGSRKKEFERREKFLRDRKGSDISEFPEYLQVRQFPILDG